MCVSESSEDSRRNSKEVQASQRFVSSSKMFCDVVHGSLEFFDDL